MMLTSPSGFVFAFVSSISGVQSQSPVRVTVGGCECLRTWEVDSSSCNDYCCNPEEADTGDWCYTVGDCGDQTWGNCAPLVNDCDCSCRGTEFWHHTGVWQGRLDNSCQMYSTHLPANERFERQYSDCCYNWNMEITNADIRAEHCCPLDLGFSDRQNDTYITVLPSDDNAGRSVNDAQVLCASLDSCVGITCTSMSNCTLRSGLALGVGAAGEFSYFRQPDGCADRPDFVDEGDYPCTEWEGFSCSDPQFLDPVNGYTEMGLMSVQLHCPQTCRLCVAELVNCPVLTSPEAGSIVVPEVAGMECCSILTAFSFSTLAQTDVLPMPWYGIVRMLGIGVCNVPEGWGGCTDDIDYQFTASTQAFGNMVRYLCDNPQCNTSDMDSSGIVSLYVDQLRMPNFHEMLRNNYLITNCETAPLPSRSGTNSALNHMQLMPAPAPLPAGTVIERTHTRDGSTEAIDRDVDIYFRVPTTRTTTELSPSAHAARGARFAAAAFTVAALALC